MTAWISMIPDHLASPELRGAGSHTSLDKARRRTVTHQTEMLPTALIVCTTGGVPFRNAATCAATA